MWTAPVVLLLMLTYYVTDIQDDLRFDPLGYSPTVVDAVLRNLTPVAYAVAAALGAWEARKLGRSGIWQAGAVRSPYVIAGQRLVPVVGLAWLVLLLPTLCGLLQTKTAPNPAALGLLAYCMALCTAHAVLGFACGVRVPHIATAPVIAVVDFLAVSMPPAMTLPWPRHLTGVYFGKLMFGELPSLASLVAPLLPALGMTAAVALLWSGIRRPWLRTTLAGTVALAGAGSAIAMVKDWSYVVPRSTGHGAVSCAGDSPRICVPTAHARALPDLRADVADALQALQKAGIDARPTSVTDSLTSLRYPLPSTATAWNLPLSAGEAAGTTRYHVARAAVPFRCSRPDTDRARQVYYWVSLKVGQGDVYLRRLATEPDFTAEQRNRLRSQVKDVLARNAGAQTNWFRQTAASACEQRT